MVLAMGVMLVTAGCTAGLDSGTGTGGYPVSAPCGAIGPNIPGGIAQPDPPTDRLGWEAGVWANESLSVSQADGLTCDELELVVARTMARVELLRELEFEQTPRVLLLSRDVFQQQTAGGSEPSAAVRRFENAKFEALFMIGEGTDAIATQQRNRGVSVGGFYIPGRNVIAFIGDTPTPQINTGVLAHELVHALQDQHFDLNSRTDMDVPMAATTDGRLGRLGLIEGDANLVEFRYEQRCTMDPAWQNTCLIPEPGDARSDSDGQLASVGPFLVSFQPYSDGPAFVERLREQGGWERVNAAYQRVPVSAEQTIHPDRYPDDRPAEVTVPDRSAATWERVRPPDGPADRLGEASLLAMFMTPYFDSGRERELIPAAEFFNRGADGELDAFDPFNYRHPYADGWEGDALVAYTDGQDGDGYVWKLQFASAAEAREFQTGYASLLQYHGGEELRDGVWVIRVGPFADAFRISRSDGTIVIVNAPTVEALSAVHRPSDTTGAS